MTNDDRLLQALAHLADTIQADYPSDHMTCSEVDALAEVLEAAGYREEAISVLFDHARAEEEEDAHYPATKLIDLDDEPAAVAWLTQFLTGTTAPLDTEGEPDDTGGTGGAGR